MIFNSSVQGASHIESGKECQDHSMVWEDPLHKIRIAVVSDGHGSERHFRSAIGSQFACEAAMDVLKELACADVSFDQDSLNQIARCICSRWSQMVNNDIESRDQKVGIEAYGCTLIAYVQTSKFWLAMQIGDGLFVMLNRRRHFRQPIKDDERCVCGYTTSMCDTNAASEFRFAFGQKRSIPKAVFLCSDGVDGTFGCGGNLYVFYWNILKCLRKDGYSAIINELPTTLSHFSEVGSKDDMSLAVIVNYKTKKYEEAFN